jgi:hypothetical protein
LLGPMKNEDEKKGERWKDGIVEKWNDGIEE